MSTRVSFLARGTLPGDETPNEFVPIPPDLAVEVIEPGDTAVEVERKRVEYLQVGVRLVWIVYPHSRTAHVHRLAGSAMALTGNDALSGEDVIPGFNCRVSDLFGGLSQPDSAADCPTFVREVAS